jgi:hypothetical protein
VAWIGAGLAVIALLLLGVEVGTRARRTDRSPVSVGASR